MSATTTAATTAAKADRTEKGAPARPGTSTAPVAKKLQIKPGYSIGLLNAPDGVRGLLEPLPGGAALVDTIRPGLDVVIGFARNAAEADALAPQAIEAVRPDGLLWLCYLKGGAKAGTDINRDILWQRVKPLGLEGVALVAVDDAWSAMRFRVQQT